MTLSLTPFTVYAQSGPASERPTIGLVLSGGGAKGMAHVSVIKVLEDVGIVPDYITGTSMGSIVGALYAIGYTADEMEDILKEITWSSLMSDKVTLQEISIEEKPYYDNYLAEFPIDTYKIGLPRGVLEGQKLSELFSKLTLRAQNIDDFSEFPIPFAALSVDVVSGKNIILNKGSLPDAMLASMAIPTIFSPVIKDTMILVDGGLARNFPVKEVKDMGADIVIGINVAGGFGKQ